MGDQSGRQQLSDALADLLTRSRKTKAQVASEGNLSRTTVSAAFSPDSPPPSDRTLEVLAEALNADPAPLRNLLAIARNEEAVQPRSVTADTLRISEPVYRIAREMADSRLREYKFDPLRPENLVHSVVERLRSVEAGSLVKAASWARDSGIYAIYYFGAHELYAPVSGTSVPLYVGGVQKGSGSVPMNAYLKPPAVSVRLDEHCRTLDQSRNLDPMDFCVRVLFIDDLFIAPAVAELTSEFKPVWNTTLDGFNLRHPGRSRIQHAARPKWHELHAGPDSWAAEMRSKRTPAELENEVRQHFAAWLR
ncbi:Eco29kI family restriction endonuclease [Kitasatospora sp. NPDC056273]|uniref:Eco29kI family restriction endonuclease n=1 Tax=Kitasatospora sp. NPDC056273 TaxID=3345769 RepID=UPI0035DF776F